MVVLGNWLWLVRVRGWDFEEDLGAGMGIQC